MLSHEAHEALCRRCGMSCFFALPVNGLPVVVDELHCKFLGRDDLGAHICTVYERRFTEAPWCQTVEQALAGGYLAQDCPYTRGVPGYRGKVRLSRSLMQQVLPGIRAEVARSGVPIGASPEDALRLLAAEGERWSYSESEDGARYVFTRIDPPAADAGPVGPPAAARRRLPVVGD